MNAPEGALQFAPADIRAARSEAKRSGRAFLEVLQERLGASPEELLPGLGAELGLATISLAQLRNYPPAFQLTPFPEAARRCCVALDAGEKFLVVLGNPYDTDTQDWIEAIVPGPFEYRLAHPADIAAYLSQQEEHLRAIDGVLDEINAASHQSGKAEEISIQTISETDSTVVKLINSTLYDALKSGASDIHLESTPLGLAVKYRIDGVLTAVESLRGTELAEEAISRIKVMSELDIAERRVPQDGRFKARSKGKDIDIRVSVIPSVHGEDAVLRILDKQSLTDRLKGLTLDQLGFTPALIERIRGLSREPYGMLLVTGPTGSGKTTTLYAAISEINRGVDKIITIEDPVEYQLPGILQIPVNEKKGLTFARGLRSILRHDPDRIMVGEIRDPETAEIAVQSALTGHLVYTTVHANNVFDVIGRFMHMRVDAHNVVSALNAVLAQRLVRVNCKHCAEDDAPASPVHGGPKPAARLPGSYRLRRGRGCTHCRGTGYKGRRAVGELLVMNDDLREMIAAREPLKKLKAAAEAAGTVPLRQAALALMQSGETTLEEINRVTLVA